MKRFEPLVLDTGSPERLAQSVEKNLRQLQQLTTRTYVREYSGATESAADGQAVRGELYVTVVGATRKLAFKDSAGTVRKVTIT